MSRRTPFSVFCLLLAGPAFAQAAEREMPLPNAAGIRLFIGEAPEEEPAGRVEAARDRMAAKLGAPITKGRVDRRKAARIAMATLSARFTDDPDTIHGWMAIDRNRRLCHITAPAAAPSMQALRPALARCADLLIGVPEAEVKEARRQPDR